MNEYEAFSLIYDSVMDNYDYDRVYHWILDVVSLEASPRILDMATGTGKLAEKLADVGTVVGFDLSEDMLVIAYERLFEKRDVQLFRMDLRDFTVPGKFDIILCLCDGLNYLSSEDELLASFKRVKEHIKRGGFFLFDLNTAHRFESEYGTFNEIREGEGYFLTWENAFTDPVNQYVLNIFLEDDDGTYRRYSEVHEERVFRHDRVKRLLKEAGLELVASYDGYSRRAATATSSRICYVVRNREEKEIM
ncbi:MAG: methyltransferase domain-containing protein [Peptoniphilus sp.]|nr:methyltransferase domain-containing protein [Peptoniphilus sp.]MDD7362530.1 methyltransferase domain-containing protein [Bacillota bacterium]MDY6045071.1 methyltransferase domain-containing protein [Peptoniphilus sp.]